MRAIARLLIFLIGMVGFMGFSTTDLSQNSKDVFVKVDKTINKADVINLLKVDSINIVSDVGKFDIRSNKAYITDKNKDLTIYMLSLYNIKNYSILRKTRIYKGNIYRKARDGLTKV